MSFRFDRLPQRLLGALAGALVPTLATLHAAPSPTFGLTHAIQSERTAPESEESVHALDPRDVYDVRRYAIDIELDPGDRSIRGRVDLEARSKYDGVTSIAVDLSGAYRVQAVHLLREPRLTKGEPLIGQPLSFGHRDEIVTIELPRPLEPEQPFALSIHYGGRTPAPLYGRGDHPYQGVFWGETKAGHPRVDVACQTVDGSVWWPCKTANYHPGDKPDSVSVALTVPEPLVAVSIGKLVGEDVPRKGWRTYRWRLDAPTPTWAVGFAAADYRIIDREVPLPGLDRPLHLSFYSTPENVDRARAQLDTIPAILQAYVERFGDYPYPHAKLAVVDSLAWSSSGATLISYGSQYPAAAGKNAAPELRIDPFLAHELAHLWWGQSVTAETWSDAWIHESFASYGLHLLRESTLGRATAERILSDHKASITEKTRIRAHGRAAHCGRQAQTSALWYKGPLVLAQLRHYLDDDGAWFDCLKGLQQRGHLGFATTDDLIELLNERTGEDWTGYFQAWYSNAGLPRLDVHVTVIDGPSLLVRASNEQERGHPWRVPIDLAWQEGSQPRTHRIWLEPGPNGEAIECLQVPTDVRIEHLERLLGRIAVTLPADD